MIYSIKPGFSWNDNNYKPGDVLNFEGGEYKYFSGANLNGTKDNPIQLNFTGSCKFTAGINLTNSSYIIGDGGVNKNLLLQTDNMTQGVPLSFQGKCNNLTFKGFSIKNCWSGIWFKTEPTDSQFWSWDYWTLNGDGSVTPSFVMDGFYLDNFDSDNVNFETIYAGSTGQDGQRTITIAGVTYNVFPHKVRNVQISNGKISNSARSGAQVSGVDSEGTSFLKNVTIINSGISKEANQGASFRIGGRSTNFEIDGCVFDGSNLYAVHSQGGGKIKFTNNTVINATKVNGVSNPQPMASVEFDTFDDNIATLQIEGNRVGASNNGVSIVVYGTTKSVSTQSTNKGNALEGLFQNFSGVEFQTGGVIVNPPPPPPPPDTSVLYFTKDDVLKTATFHRADGTTTVYNNVDRAIGSCAGKFWRVMFNNGDKPVKVI